MPTFTNNDIKLMLAMIASAESLKTDNATLAELVGNGATPNAIRQRVAKIKNHAKAILAGEALEIVGPGGKAKAPAPAPPGKRRAADLGNEEGNGGCGAPLKRLATKKAGTVPTQYVHGHAIKKEGVEAALRMETEDDAGTDIPVEHGEQ